MSTRPLVTFCARLLLATAAAAPRLAAQTAADLEALTVPAEPVRPALIPQPDGGALYAAGVKGHKGGAGRPLDAFKAGVEALLQKPEIIEELRQVVTDRRDPRFVKALEFCAKIQGLLVGAPPLSIQTDQDDQGGVRRRLPRVEPRPKVGQSITMPKTVLIGHFIERLRVSSTKELAAERILQP